MKDHRRGGPLDQRQRGPVNGPKDGRRARSGLVFMASILLSLTGCGGSGGGTPRTVAVSPADFVASEAAATPATPAPVVPRPDPRVSRTGPVAASEGIFDVTSQVGPPELSASDAGPVEEPRLVQAKVGDINGRPIYAMDFLAPMADRLQAEAKKETPAKWMKFAEEEIRRELDAQIENELLVAEARESLTPEQRQGFFAFLEDMRANLYSENRGSRAAANKRLFDTEGVNEEQWLKSREEQALIRHQLSEQIDSKTVVSWREIRQAYELHYDRWNPPPTAHFNIIRVSDSKADTVERVTSALDRGESFLTLAASPDNEWKRADAGHEARRFKGEFNKAEFFGPEKLNEAARSLEPGQWAGPVPWGATSTWVFLERIDRRSLSLFQAQLQIERTIREAKSTYRRKKYVERMKAQASITDVDEMTRRLLAIAAERYLPRGAPPPSAAPMTAAPPAASSRDLK